MLRERPEKGIKPALSVQRSIELRSQDTHCSKDCTASPKRSDLCQRHFVMPIYTFEKHQASNSLAGKLAIVDTSYMIVLSDEDDQRNEIVAPFHINASENGATFAINSVVRQEFITSVRKKVLIDAILSLAASDPVLDARYKSVLKQNKALSVDNLKHGYEQVYKDHLKRGDDTVILSQIAASNDNIWEEVSNFEAATNLVYTRPKQGTNGDDLWQSLGI